MGGRRAGGRGNREQTLQSAEPPPLRAAAAASGPRLLTRQTGPRRCPVVLMVKVIVSLLGLIPRGKFSEKLEAQAKSYNLKAVKTWDR